MALLKRHKILAVIFIVILVLAAFDHTLFSTHLFGEKDDTLTESEISFLSDYYVEDKDSIQHKILISDQRKLLCSYRALERYINCTYSDVTFSAVDVLPSSASGMDYDMYSVSVNGSKEYLFHVSRSAEGKYEVTYDEYAYS